MSERTLLHTARTLIERAVDRLETSEESASRLTIGRRSFLLASSTSLAATWLAACGSEGPDSARRLLSYASRKNESVERWLLRHTAMDHARSGAATAGMKFPSYYVSPTTPIWDPAVRGAWTLEVSGLVRRPLRLTLEELRHMPSKRQRVNHYCVEGWNAVAEFWGVPLAEIAKAAEVDPQAKYVDFASFDDNYHESWDLESATHPQTLVVYAKDGMWLPPAYGAPARVHSPVKLGYKNTKYLTKIVFMPARNGGYWSDRGYEWYGGT